MTYTYSKDDIPRNLAVSAYNGTSWSPERRADTTLADYAQQIDAIAAQFAAANVPPEEFERFRQSYRRRFTAWLAAKSRCISSFITGPSNFPTRRAEKANRSEDNRFQELIDFRNRIAKKICNRYNPNPNIIRSDDPGATAKLKTKIETEEKSLDHMKAVNAAWRKYAKDQNPAPLQALGYSEERIKSLAAEIENAYSWQKQPFLKFQLSNLGANIRRMKERLALLEKQSTEQTTEKTINGIRILDNVEQNRLQLFFPSIPSEPIRHDLKANGFKWSPSNSCWQRFRSNIANYEAERIINELPQVN